MAEKNSNENTNSIPVSVLIADARNKLNEVVNHPLLPPSIVELILKEAWQTVAIKAQSQLVSDYGKYQENNKDIAEQEYNNGL
ncbi:MAG: hypothetical protein U0L70_03890 [Ruminococcus sp.]|nr:hypothetical protein [Ruminococcus sp.]